MRYLHTKPYSCLSSKRHTSILLSNTNPAAFCATSTQFKPFTNKTNKKHHLIKLDLKFSKEKIEFLDTLIYQDHDNCSQTTLKKSKLNDHQNYVNRKFAHPLSLKRSISIFKY